MVWHDIRNPKDPELDRLAAEHHLHPLHIEDCRHRNQRAKVEDGAGYIFVVLKPLRINEEGDIEVQDLDVFLGPDFLITVQEDDCPEVRVRLDALRTPSAGMRSDQLFYRIFDGVVDSYLPTGEWFSGQIDRIEDLVLKEHSPQTLDYIFSVKRGLIELRRVLSNTRDVAGHVQRMDTSLIQRDLWPFLRDVYDHAARQLDVVEVQRDLLSGALDIYLSSVANRTNQVVKVLTIVGTIALPALVISGIYGMNLQGLPWQHAAHGAWYVTGIVAGSTALLLLLLKRFGWW